MSEHTQLADIQDKEHLIARYNAYPPKWVTPTIQLSVWRPEDREHIFRYMNMPEIHPFLSGPPFPYTLEDSDFWVTTGFERTSKNGTPLDLCIRDMTKGGLLIGSVHVGDQSDENLDGDDVGYWLAPEYHGQGIMTKALKLMLYESAVKEFGKRKFNAHAFVDNWASRRTLEKVGFVHQPDREASVVKNGQTLKMWVFRMYLSEEDVTKQEAVAEVVPLHSLSLEQ
ncbi:hypothetical protein CPC16_003267 [Podila verticillata]|nr:hypothetical protein CPC16_003267 [Podila verticillata]KAI9240894.1 MAG: acyl-CoA N-acyltransferase [Podila humilis]